MMNNLLFIRYAEDGIYQLRCGACHQDIYQATTPRMYTIDCPEFGVISPNYRVRYCYQCGTRFTHYKPLSHSAHTIWLTGPIEHRLDEFPLWESEFGGEYRVPMWIQLRFPDISWHNDVSPSFQVSGNEYQMVRLWVDHPKKMEREVPGNRRFSLTWDDYNGTSDLPLNKKHSTLLTTDNEDEMISYLQI